jgi:hypothetical protein
MNKRPQIKGRGADIYLGSTEEDNMPASTSTAAETAAVKPKHTERRRMVTTYLPPHIVDRLHQVWLTRVQKDPKAQKAHIITEALERFFNEPEADTKPSEQPNIKTSEQHNV